MRLGGQMFAVKSFDGVENSVCHQWFRTNCARIIERAPVQKVWISPENFLLTGSEGRCGLNAEQNRDILVAMQAVGDEKGHDDDIGLRGVFAPIRDEWRLLHVGLENFSV